MKHKGFTLIELMLVLSLLGLLFSLTWPAYGGLFQNYRLDAAADYIEDSVAFARTSAVMENRRYRLVFQNLPFNCDLYKEERSGNQSVFVPYDGRWFKSRSAWKDLRLEGVQELDFYPDGTCLTSEFHLKDQRGKSLYLKLDGVHATLHKIEKTI